MPVVEVELYDLPVNVETLVSDFKRGKLKKCGVKKKRDGKLHTRSCFEFDSGEGYEIEHAAADAKPLPGLRYLSLRGGRYPAGGSRVFKVLFQRGKGAGQASKFGVTIHQPKVISTVDEDNSDARRDLTQIMREAQRERECNILLGRRHRNFITVKRDGKTINVKVYCLQTRIIGEELLVAEKRFCELSLEAKMLAVYHLLKQLALLHAAKLIHKDIKPSNVMLTADDLLSCVDAGGSHHLVRDAALSGIHRVRNISTEYLDEANFAAYRYELWAKFSISVLMDVYGVGKSLVMIMRRSFKWEKDKTINYPHWRVVGIKPTDKMSQAFLEEVLTWREEDRTKRRQTVTVMMQQMEQIFENNFDKCIRDALAKKLAGSTDAQPQPQRAQTSSPPPAKKLKQ